MYESVCTHHTSVFYTLDFILCVHINITCSTRAGSHRSPDKNYTPPNPSSTCFHNCHTEATQMPSSPPADQSAHPLRHALDLTHHHAQHVLSVSSHRTRKKYKSHTQYQDIILKFQQNVLACFLQSFLLHLNLILHDLLLIEWKCTQL